MKFNREINNQLKVCEYGRLIYKSRHTPLKPWEEWIADQIRCDLFDEAPILEVKNV